MIQNERITEDLLNEVVPLLKKHYNEVGTEGYAISPDRAIYIKSSASGLYACYTLRVVERLVGYLGFWILSHPHYLMNVAQMDLLFIEKEYRGGSAVKLIKFSEIDLKENYNIDVIFQSTSSKRDIGPLFLRLGYKNSDKMFMKEL